MHLKHVSTLQLIASAGLLLQPVQSTANTQGITLNTYSELTQSSNQQPIVLYKKALNHLLGKKGIPKSAEKAAVIFKILAEKNDLLAYKWLSLATKNNPHLAKVINKKRRLLHYKLKERLSGRSFYKLETWIAEWKPSST